MTELVRVLFVDLARRLGEAIGDIARGFSTRNRGTGTHYLGALSLVKRNVSMAQRKDPHPKDTF